MDPEHNQLLVETIFQPSIWQGLCEVVGGTYKYVKSCQALIDHQTTNPFFNYWRVRSHLLSSVSKWGPRTKKQTDHFGVVEKTRHSHIQPFWHMSFLDATSCNQFEHLDNQYQKLGK